MGQRLGHFVKMKREGLIHWRRMDTIAWTDQKTNVEVLVMLEEKQSVVKTVL